jgi:hypothetical protein
LRALTTKFSAFLVGKKPKPCSARNASQLIVLTANGKQIAAWAQHPALSVPFETVLLKIAPDFQTF